MTDGCVFSGGGHTGHLGVFAHSGVLIGEVSSHSMYHFKCSDVLRLLLDILFWVHHSSVKAEICISSCNEDVVFSELIV